MKKIFSSLLFWLSAFGLGVPPLLAQNLGVTVKIGITSINGGATDYVTTSSLATPDFPTGNFICALTGSGGAGQTTVGTVELLPDKNYQFTWNAGGPTGGRSIAVAAPPGFQVWINGQMGNFHYWSYFAGAPPYAPPGPSTGFFQVRIVSASPAGGRAGAASALTGGQIRWDVSLGSLKSGRSAGSLVIVDPGTATGSTPWGGIFTSAALQYQPPSAEIVAYPDASGRLRQILANQAYIDIVTVSSTSYQIDFYTPSSLGTQVYTLTTPYVFSGTPYVSYLIKQGATATTLMIISTTRNLANGTVARYAVTTLARTGTSTTDFQWVMDDWNDCDVNGNVTAGQQVREEKRVWGGTTSDPTETLTVYQPGAASADLTVTNGYHLFNWGKRSVSTILGSVNPTPASTVNFVTDNASISYGLPKSTVSSTGTWTGFDYCTTIDARWYWTVSHQYRPFNNLALPATFSLTSGEVTTFQYTTDAFNVPSLPTSIVTQINGTTTTQSTIDYASQTAPDGQAMRVVTKTDYSAAATPISSITRYYFENLTDDFFNSQIRSTVQPDGVQVSYAYQRGTFNPGQIGQAAFTPSADNSVNSNATGSSIAMITGSAIATNGAACTTYRGFTVDTIYLIEGKSTLQVTLRDSLALVRSVQSYAWVSGSWVLVGYTNYTFDASGQLTGTAAMNGVTTSNIFKGEQVQSVTDASGVVVSYTYDRAGRLATVAKGGGPMTTYTYNSNGQVLSQTLSDGGVDTPITASTSYFDSGLIKNETPAGLSPVTYTYAYGPNAGGVTNATYARTATFPDGGTRIEAAQLDGRPLAVAGTAVVEQDVSYALDATNSGFMASTVRIGSTTSSRWSTEVVDWLGRAVSSTHPGFTGQGNFVQTNIYENGGTGHLLQMNRTGYAPVKYQYDAMGNVNRSGMDLGNDNLALASNDLITDSDQFIEAYTPPGGTSAYWLHQESKVYPTANSGASLTTAVTRKRLTGFPAGRFEEALTTDTYNNIGKRTVDVNTGTKTVTVTTTLPGVSSAQVETMVNGLRTRVVGVDGLATNFGYDGLERPTTVTDSRSNTTTSTYVAGTHIPYQVMDATNTTVATYGYDTQGRRTSVTDALGFVSYSSYNQRGQVTAQWGTGTLPVSYTYNAFGERATMSTYRSGGTAFTGSTWPSTPPPADTTSWFFDAPSGLLSTKTDAAGKAVTYTYNVAGQTASRIWARLTPDGSAYVTTNYTYDTNTALGNGTGTGALKGVTYNDGTHAVSYAYNRTGQMQSVSDATGSRTFNYTNVSQPMELTSLSFDSGFYFSRVLTRKYNSDGLLPGRSSGFQLGNSGNASADLSQTYGFNSQGYFSSLTSTAQNGANSVILNYGYLTNAPLVQSIAIPSVGAYGVARSYDPKRNLLTSIQNQWGSTTVSQFDYTYNTLGQRTYSKQSGSAYADYYSGQTYDSVYNYQKYDGYGELKSQSMYRGAPPSGSTLPAAGDQLPGHNNLFSYDTIGNRTSAGETGTASDDTYVPNALNQYSSKTNKSVRIVGNVNSSATVTSSSGTAVNKLDRNFALDVLPGNNTAGPAQGSITLTANVSGSAATTVSRNYFIPAVTQFFTYDADGNMTFDGIWNYAYDAENRLSSMTNTLANGFQTSNQTLYFTYDYLNRRVGKQVYKSGTPIFDRRYIYDGWNLIAETDTAGKIQRSYTWGLDLTGSLSATAGVGALLELTNYTYNAGGTLTGTTNYFTEYDGNGNVAALIRSDGYTAAVYEYGPYGETVRNDVYDSAVADNAFRFSTKFTDAETGLINYGNRYYSPTLGRFINRDLIEEAGGLNLYGFCGNDGVNRFDVLGNSWLSKLLKGITKILHKITRALLPIRALRSMDRRLERWEETHQQELKMAAAIIAAIVTYGAASEWAAGQMTSSIANSAYLAASGGPMAGMAAAHTAVLAASTQIAVVSGIVGGAAAGAVSGLIMTGTVKGTLQGAAAGAIMGGIGGYYGRSWTLSRVAATSVGGGLASEVSGGSFRNGAIISGGIAFVTYGAIKIRQYEIAHSPPEALGKDSVGFNGDGVGIAGARPEQTGIDPTTGNPILKYRGSLLGGDQGKPGSIFGIPYGRGDIPDYVNEAFGGVHDFLNHSLNYNAAGYNQISGSVIGGAIMRATGTSVIATGLSNVMNWTNVFLAAPIVATSVVGITPGAMIGVGHQASLNEASPGQ